MRRGNERKPLPLPLHFFEMEREFSEGLYNERRVK
jgi:hypothetical protein